MKICHGHSHIGKHSEESNGHPFPQKKINPTIKIKLLASWYSRLISRFSFSQKTINIQLERQQWIKEMLRRRDGRCVLAPGLKNSSLTPPPINKSPGIVSHWGIRIYNPTFRTSQLNTHKNMIEYINAMEVWSVQCLCFSHKISWFPLHIVHDSLYDQN